MKISFAIFAEINSLKVFTDSNTPCASTPDQSNIVYVDETDFNLHKSNHYGYSLVDNKAYHTVLMNCGRRAHRNGDRHFEVPLFRRNARIFLLIDLYDAVPPCVFASAPSHYRVFSALKIAYIRAPERTKDAFPLSTYFPSFLMGTQFPFRALMFMLKISLLALARQNFI